MRIYNTLIANAFFACIWQIAKVTFVVPTFFPFILIDDVRYEDGDTDWNNSIKKAIIEVHNIWSTCSIECVISIDIELEEALQLNDKSKELSTLIDVILRKTSSKLAYQIVITKYCVKCLTSCEITHREVTENSEKIILGDNYFRLNVSQEMSKIELDEWNKLKNMIALIKSYITHLNLLKSKQRIAKFLQNSQIANLFFVWIN